MSDNPNPEKDNSHAFNSQRANEFIFFVIGAAGLITLASVIAEFIQTTQ